MSEPIIKERWYCRYCKFTYESITHLVECGCANGHQMRKVWDRRNEKVAS